MNAEDEDASLFEANCAREEDEKAKRTTSTKERVIFASGVKRKAKQCLIKDSLGKMITGEISSAVCVWMKAQRERERERESERESNWPRYTIDR